jgi:hypothetical protein
LQLVNPIASDFRRTCWGGGGGCLSDHFTVTEPVLYQFTLAGSAFGGNSFAYSQQFDLSGRTFVFGGVFSGLLLPGQTYVFTASQSFFGPSDFLGGAFLGNSNGEMQFSSVPEPSVFSCLLLGVFAIALYSRRTPARVAATPRSLAFTARRRAG